MGLSHIGPAYQRVNLDPDRLAGVQIYAKNAFYDRTVGKYTSVSFSIIESYVLYDEAPGRKTGQLQFKHLSSITWSDVMFKSFLAGNLKRLDLNRYFSLKTATARRLYRFLDKRFYDNKSSYETNLMRLAHERLGMSRSRRYPSQIREKLKDAHEELVALGFLAGVEYREGREGEVVVYCPGTAPPEGNASTSPAQKDITARCSSAASRSAVNRPWGGQDRRGPVR